MKTKTENKIQNENKVVDVETPEIETPEIVTLELDKNRFNIKIKSDKTNFIEVNLSSVSLNKKYDVISDKNNIKQFKSNPLYYLGSLNTQMLNNNVLLDVDKIDVDMDTRSIKIILNSFNGANWFKTFSVTETRINGVFERDLNKFLNPDGASNGSRTKNESKKDTWI